MYEYLNQIFVVILKNKHCEDVLQDTIMLIKGINTEAYLDEPQEALMNHRRLEHINV